MGSWEQDQFNYSLVSKPRPVDILIVFYRRTFKVAMHHLYSNKETALDRRSQGVRAHGPPPHLWSLTSVEDVEFMSNFVLMVIGSQKIVGNDRTNRRTVDTFKTFSNSKNHNLNVRKVHHTEVLLRNLVCTFIRLWTVGTHPALLRFGESLVEFKEQAIPLGNDETNQNKVDISYMIVHIKTWFSARVKKK